MSVFEFSAQRVNVVFDRRLTITLPVPAGLDGHDFQPVAIDARGGLTYLVGRAEQASVSFEVAQLGLYGLAKVTRPELVGTVPSIVKVDGYHARRAEQSRNVELAVGQVAELTARFVNSGSLGWTVGVPGQQAVLGSIGPLDNTRDADAGILVAPLYNRNRYATTTESYVGPGDVGTFTFRVRAPDAPGTYRLRLRPVIDGVAWLEDEGASLQIIVR